MDEQELRYIPRTALFAALVVIFPQFFHMIGLGSKFLPMFLLALVLSGGFGNMLQLIAIPLALRLIEQKYPKFTPRIQEPNS